MTTWCVTSSRLMFFFLMIRRPPRSTLDRSSAASDVYKRQLYAPKGVGALYIRRGTPMVPFVLGAGHERGLRPGTENVAAIVGLGMACEIAGSDMETVAACVAALRDDLWQRLAAAVPGVMLNGHRTLRLPNTLNVRFPRVSGNTILQGAPEIAASTGSACHAGGESASAVILAMGVAADDAIGSIRLTLGRGTTAADIEVTADALGRSWRSASLAGIRGPLRYRARRQAVPANPSGQVTPGSGVQDTAESLAAQLAARECTAGAGRAADDDPSVRIKCPGAFGKILQRNVQAPRSMSGGEFARRTHIHHLGPFLQQRGDPPSRKK